MERRLLPVNAILALCGHGGGSDGGAPLKAAGFRVVALELPAGPTDDRVVVDILLIHEPTNLLITCESKSGANVEVQQAQSYSRLSGDELVRSAAVTLTRRGDRSVQLLYVCLGEHVERPGAGTWQARSQAAS